MSNNLFCDTDMFIISEFIFQFHFRSSEWSGTK